MKVSVEEIDLVDATQELDMWPDGEQATSECAQPTESDRVHSLSLNWYKYTQNAQKLAQVNFSSPWEHVCSFWQYLQLYLKKTWPNLTLPDKSQ